MSKLFPMPLSAVGRVGTDLRRPECVLCTRAGDLIVAHLGHGIMWIRPDGSQTIIGDVAAVDGHPFIPNGIAFTEDAAFLITNMGQAGGLWRLERDGKLSPVLRHVDGIDLTATNFVLRDRAGRLWITVTTRHWPISEAFSPLEGPEIRDGYIILLDGSGARIVADGLAFANELRLSPDEDRLYVAETYGRRVTRFDIGGDGRLTNRSVFAQFGAGIFPDGMAFDAEGFLWVVSVTSNKVLRLGQNGGATEVLAETNADYVRTIEARMSAGTLRREDVQQTPSRLLKNIASITFGGPDLRSVYLGSLGGDSLALFASPVAGAPLSHWPVVPSL